MARVSFEPGTSRPRDWTEKSRVRKLPRDWEKSQRALALRPHCLSALCSEPHRVIGVCGGDLEDTDSDRLRFRNLFVVVGGIEDGITEVSADDDGASGVTILVWTAFVSHLET